MIKQRPFLNKNKKKIDYTFLFVLFAAVLILGFFYGVNHTYDSKNQSITMALDLPAEQTQYNYENFWHKFNTYSVVMINLRNTQHLVSQVELEKFQADFFKDFGLTNQDKIVTHAGTPVDPNVLFCYMKGYDPSGNVTSIIKSCAK
jgi:hypothetical protein